MKKLTCLIVEDEPVSQEILTRYIHDCAAVELLGICNDAIEASQQVRINKPDLLFLDITMPKLSGIDFYRSLTNPPAVIFTTAYPQYAVEGFEVNAIDYLVKPFSFERFVKAMNKAQETLGASPHKGQTFITLQADKKIYKVDLTDILFAEAMGDYVKVVLSNRTLIVHQTLQGLQQLLPASEFRRVHKSYLIPFQRFDYLEGNMIVIKGHKIPIGQTYRSELMEIIQKR